MSTPPIAADPVLCSYCAVCAKVCPRQAIVVKREARLHRVLADRCNSCGVCVEACPKAGLKMA